MKTTGRILLRLIRVVILLLPLVVLARGAVYLRRCLDVLASPGTGLDFTYEAKKGAILHITADSYNFDIESGRLNVFNPKLQDSEGQLLAQADMARVDGLQLGTAGAINANVFRLQGKLVRMKNGHFALEDYLPEKTPTTENRPFHVRINGVDLLFEDHSGKGVFDQRVVSDEMTVDGIGDDWVASGTLTLPEIGIANASVQRYKNSGLVIALNAQQLNLGRAVNHFRTTPEGKNLEPLRMIRSDTLLAEGPVRLFFPENNPFELAASIDASGTNVVYNGTDRFDTASFDGLVTGSGASGELTVSRGSAHGKFVGATDWSRASNFAGQIDAVVGNRGDIPPSLVTALPKELSFSGARAQGWLSFDEKDGFRYDGNLNAQSFTISGHKFGTVTGAMRAGKGLVRIEGAQGVWQGSQLSGNLAYFPEDKKILGIVGGPAIQLASVAKEIKMSGLSGTASGEALLSGTIDKPIAAIRASGTASYRGPQAARALSGTFQGAGNYSGITGLDVTSLSVDTKTGTVSATGHADPKGALALNVAARGVQLSAFAPDISGSASFSGAVSGTASNPQLVGKAQVVEMEIADQQIPLVIADIKADRNRVSATSIDAARGAALASGHLAYNFNSGGISGLVKATNFALNDLNEQVQGFVDVSNARIAGTINNPIIDAEIATHALQVADRSIGRGQATIALRGNEFQIPKLSARFAGGTVTGSAKGNIKTKETRLVLNGEGLSLPDLVPEISDSAALDGTVTADAVATLSGAELRYARANGKLADVKVNQTLVGNGSWSASASPDLFAGAFQVGILDRYLDVSNLSVNRQTSDVNATLAAYLIPLQDIYSAAHRYMPEPTSDLQRRLLRVQGTADAVATISGNINDPDLMVNTLNLMSLSLEGKQLGEMKFAFNKTGRVWTVAEASWMGEAGSLRSSGRADLDKEIEFEGDFTNVDLALLSIIDDNLTRIGGRAAISFAVTGPTQSPLIQASLDASRTKVLTGTADEAALEFGMVLDTINVSESSVGPDGRLVGGIDASGKLFYRGLEGNIFARVPLKYPLTLPEGDPLQVGLDFPQRDLQTLGDYIRGLDVKRTEGTIRGNITMSGQVGNAKIDGHLTAEAKTLAVNKVQTTLSNAVASVSANQEAFKLHFAGIGSEGGTIALDANSPIGDVSDRIRELTSRGLDSLLDRPVTGDLSMVDFGIRYNGGPENGRLVALANAKINASGPLRQPAVTGNANVANVSTLLPSWEVTSTPPVTYAIDPTFNIKLLMDNVAEVSTSLAKLKVMGAGDLHGSLNKPSVTSDLTVLGGTVSLPTASVRIEPGGSVRLRYQTGPGGDTLASLNVDLTGETHITTLDAGDVPQRYEITLHIRGDLLQEGETFITAESDPPGLSQDRIVALLGQADLIQALAGSVSNLQASKELRNVLAGVALPALLSPLTGAFAKGLGLDYLDVSYDPLNQVSVSFAKDLGKNFSVQGTRQVSQPLPGIEPQYEFKLVYRLPFKGKEFRRTTVSFGVDQDRPWKVGIQYGFRF